MSTFIRAERNTLRAIQDHILAQRRSAGAAYTQIGTVGVVFHADKVDPDLNLVAPHQGLAWTRSEDLRQGFDLLERRGRLPRLQYVRGLFPEAFSRQLSLYGLRLESEVPIWLYAPIQGPFPAGEHPFGRAVIIDDDDPALEFSVEIVSTRLAMANWLRVYRSASYGVDIHSIEIEDVASLLKESGQSASEYVLGYHHDHPIAAARISLGQEAAEIVEPVIIWPWNGMGFEEKLLAHAIQSLQEHERRIVYTVGNMSHDPNLYWRLGFVPITQILTYVRST